MHGAEVVLLAKTEQFERSYYTRWKCAAMWQTVVPQKKSWSIFREMAASYIVPFRNLIIRYYSVLRESRRAIKGRRSRAYVPARIRLRRFWRRLSRQEISVSAVRMWKVKTIRVSWWSASGGAWIMASNWSRCGHLGDGWKILSEDGFDRRRVWDWQAKGCYRLHRLRQKFRQRVARSLSRRVSLCVVVFRNVALSVLNGKKCCDASDGYDFHAFGVSGPAVLLFAFVHQV